MSGIRDSEDLRGWTADELCVGWRGQESDSERSHGSGQGITQKTSGEAHAVLGFPKWEDPVPTLQKLRAPGTTDRWE